MRSIDLALGAISLIKDVIDITFKLVPYLIEDGVSFEIRYITDAFYGELYKPVIVIRKGSDVVKEAIFKDIWFHRRSAEAIGELLMYTLNLVRKAIKEIEKKVR